MKKRRFNRVINLMIARREYLRSPGHGRVTNWAQTQLIGCPGTNESEHELNQIDEILEMLSADED